MKKVNEIIEFVKNERDTKWKQYCRHVTVFDRNDAATRGALSEYEALAALTDDITNDKGITYEGLKYAFWVASDAELVSYRTALDLYGADDSLTRANFARFNAIKSVAAQLGLE